ncbi:unnamed protein product, partial [Ectocarpus fasciculatus]
MIFLATTKGLLVCWRTYVWQTEMRLCHRYIMWSHTSLAAIPFRGAPSSPILSWLQQSVCSVSRPVPSTCMELLSRCYKNVDCVTTTHTALHQHGYLEAKA